MFGVATNRDRQKRQGHGAGLDGEGAGGKNCRAAFSQAVRLRKNARLVFLWLSAAV
jgi:hypothetical protein